MRAVIALAALVLAGCTTYSEDRSQLDAVIAALVGKPVSTAISTLGVPSRTMPAGSSTVYVWSRDNVLYPGVDNALKCEIRLMVSAAEIVSAGEHEGNNYACSELAARIRR